jgi:glutamine amidotransferase
MKHAPRISLIDYGMGNLHSVSKTLEKVGAKAEWVSAPRQLKDSDVMILPGVGAFEMAVKNLKLRNLFDAVGEWAASGKPFFGICLGYQLLFESSEESERGTKGLGIFKGKVKKIRPGKGFKIPHMGWNQVQVNRKNAGPLAGIKDGTYFYFVHSYVPVPSEKERTATTTDYGTNMVSSIAKQNLFACQFHPEKSGKMGQKLLKNFIDRL